MGRGLLSFPSNLIPALGLCPSGLAANEKSWTRPWFDGAENYRIGIWRNRTGGLLFGPGVSPALQFGPSFSSPTFSISMQTRPIRIPFLYFIKFCLFIIVPCFVQDICWNGDELLSDGESNFSHNLCKSVIITIVLVDILRFTGPCPPFAKSGPVTSK